MVETMLILCSINLIGNRKVDVNSKYLISGAPVGYAYFDIFSHTGGRSNKVRMVSPTITKGIADHMCFSFWFAAFGAGIYLSLFFYVCIHIFNFLKLFF